MDTVREESLSRFFEDYAAQERPSALRFLAGRPLRSVRALRDVASLPRLRARLSDSAEGLLIRSSLERPASWAALQRASAVLVIPQQPQDYSLGSSKQTLRRKARSAVKAGVRWERVDDLDERRRVLAIADAFELDHGLQEYREHPRNNEYLLDVDLWLVAYAADGRPLLLSVTPVDGVWAVLANFRTTDESPDASTARYLMTQILAEELSRRGVRYLVDYVHPARLTNGLRHFQRMVGFRLARLDLHRGVRLGNGDEMKIMTLAIELEPVGGIESVTLEDSRELIARGHSVEVLYTTDGSQRPEYEAAGITLSGPWLFGVQGPNAIAALRQIPRTVRYLRRRRPDVLWLSRSEFLPWAQIVSRLAGIPVVCHIHNVPNFRFTSLLGRGIRASVAVSHSVRRQWVSAGLDPKSVTVLHNGVAAEDYPFAGVEERDAARLDLDLPGDVPIVLYLGRIAVQKGVSTLLTSWRSVHEQHPGAHLLLVGAPEPSTVPEFTEALAALPASSWSWRPLATDVVPYLHAADVVVLPSVYEDPLPRVVLETLATGRPIVGSAIGGIPEMLDGDLSRWLVKAGDDADLADRLVGLLDWRDLEPGIAEEARAAVERHFPIQAHVDGLEAVLRQASRG